MKAVSSIRLRETTSGGRRLAVLSGTLVCAVAMALCTAAGAGAADTVYWVNRGDDTVARANLDGSGAGARLDTTGADVDYPRGIAIDPAAGRIYWANGAGGAGDNGTIAYANLSGGGGGALGTGAATVKGVAGLAIDPVARRIYWANVAGDRISWASLDGSAGGDLTTTGATLSYPTAVAIDPAAGRIYWPNFFAGTISWAKLDGSGGGDLDTSGGTVGTPNAVAIDPVARRIYWANGFPGEYSISYASLNGGGGGDLNTAGATLASPAGLAIDPAAGRIYWGNEFDDRISFARLDGSGGGDLDTTGASSDDAIYPALLKAPVAAGAPVITGGARADAPLTCSPGTWAPDLFGSFLFRAPQRFGYQWIRDGAELPNVTASTYRARTSGTYVCRVTAINQAGPATQASGPAYRAYRPKLRIRARPRRVRVRPGRRVTFRVTVSNRGTRTANGVDICLRVPKRARKGLRGPKCRGLHSIGIGTAKHGKLKVRVKRRARGSYKLRIFIRGGGGARAARVRLKVKRRGADRPRPTHRRG